MEPINLPKLHQEYMADVHSVMQISAKAFQKEFNRAKEARCTDKKAERIALKRSKTVWNIQMDAMEKKYADLKPQLEEYARGEILKLQGQVVPI